MNKIWNWLLLIGILFSMLTGSIESLGNVIVSSAQNAFNIFLKVALLILFWNGMFNIAIKSGLIKNMVFILKKPLSFIFKNVDPDSICMEYICSNVVANMLGLGSAATPLGLKAFEELQKINNKDYPSRDMVKFVLLNISTLTFFPTTIISLRSVSGGKTEMSLVLLMIIVTMIATILTLLFEIIFYKVFERRNNRCK